MKEKQVQGPLNVFYCYAHEDELFCQELNKHLSALRQEGYITVWYDQNMHPGEEWHGNIKTRLKTADLVILLVSADFLASDYCYSEEMQKALERQRAGLAKVIPILVHPVIYEDTPIGKLNVLSFKGRAVSLAEVRDIAWRSIAHTIRREVRSMLRQRQRELTESPVHHPQKVIFSRKNWFIAYIALLIVLASFIGIFFVLRKPISPAINATIIATAASTAYHQSILTNGVMGGEDAQRSGYNPYEKILTSSNVSQLAKAWADPLTDLSGNGLPCSSVECLSIIIRETETESHPLGFTGPVVADDAVYVPVGQTMYAVDVQSGRGLWHYVTHDSQSYRKLSAPAIFGNTLYFGSSEGSVYALDAKSGAIKWKYVTGASINSNPVVVNGVVYIGSDDHHLYALDAESGQKLWTFAISGFSNSPAFANGMIYFDGDAHGIYAIDAKSGQQKWLYTNDLPVDTSEVTDFFDYDPMVADGIVYFGSSDQYLHAVDARTGTPLWSFPTHGYVYKAPTFTNGTIYFGSTDQNIYALNAKTGKQIWSYTTNDEVLASPIIANNVVYVGSYDSIFYALEAKKGTRLWSYTTEDRIYAPATLANGALYFFSADGNLYAFHISTRT